MSEMSDNVYSGAGSRNIAEFRSEESGAGRWILRAVVNHGRCDICGRTGDGGVLSCGSVARWHRGSERTIRCGRPECDPVETRGAPVAEVAVGAGELAEGSGPDASGALVARDPARGAPGDGAPRVARPGNDAPNDGMASAVDGPDYGLICAAVDRAVRLAIELQSMAILVESMPELRVPIRRLSERATEAQRAAETVLRCELGSHPLPRGGAR